ncbi:flagellar basal-body MS-ring/collar protein FliF [Pannonibacter indicus]|uniref:Flagellar M-ring protein n=1 Tax=Pannonibacter indicus TaxID=466044 RepID=A0A0K6HN21_9HYPH|nr:flagellar basal-body MS-ring/collar protein FliF [Pannonibacter indicus]CUA92274.1 flagellar basal-body M-ring protein/flagellar hook-basal body protein (fliF) [Pannonibacter indicus]
MNGLIEFIRTLGAARVAAMGAVAAILIGVFAFIILRVTAPQMAQLYSDLSLEDSAAIINSLEQQAIPFELRREGSTILIPQEQIARVRMRLAENGLPTGGSIGYEIFDRSDTLGATSFIQNINHLRAMEGELARTIRSIDRIVSARVHLVIPERQLFQRDARPPSASIAVKVRGSLGAGEIRAIQHLVAAAVDGLTPERVSIVDDAGRLLASSSDDNAQAMLSTQLQERTFEVEQRLRNQVEEILNSVVGPGRARVRVAAQIDHNRVTETQERFDPEGQVVRSTQTKEEASSRGAGQNAVTVGNQLPNADQGGAGAGDVEASNINEEIVNYEISKATRTEVVEAGSIKRLSVAVLVDGVYTPNADGVLQYEPRTQEVLDRIAVLVRSAVGFDAARGDVVEVVNLRFAQAPEADFEPATTSMFDFTRDDIMRFAELGVLMLIALLLLLFVVRPLLRRIVTPDEKQPQELVIAPDGTLVAESELPQQQDDEDDGVVIEWLEEAKREGAMQASSIAKVGAMIEDYPTEAVTIVRGWLEEAA